MPVNVAFNLRPLVACMMSFATCSRVVWSCGLNAEMDTFSEPPPEGGLDLVTNRQGADFADPSDFQSFVTVMNEQSFSSGSKMALPLLITVSIEAASKLAQLHFRS